VTSTVLALDWGNYWQQSIFRVLGGVVFVILGAGTFVIAFLFKMMSYMQSRLGPMEAGPHGTLQLVAEVGKWLQKEDLVPDRADARLFKLAPYIVLASTFLLAVVMPFGPDAYFTNLDTGVFLAPALSAISVIGIIVAGWASSNKYSLIGGLRAAGQLIAYELPMVLAVVGVVIQAGTINMQGIVAAQMGDGAEIFGLPIIGNPYILTQFVGMLIFITAIQAELSQTPFDMPVAESEIVGGYMVEYTGTRFLLFFLAEFSSAFAFAAIAATLFLGGWALPHAWGIPYGAMHVLGPFVLLAKTMAFALIIFWVRFTFPRLREDQLQKFAWKVLIPVALANIMLTAVLKVVF